MLPMESRGVCAKPLLVLKLEAVQYAAWRSHVEVAFHLRAPWLISREDVCAIPYRREQLL